MQGEGKQENGLNMRKLKKYLYYIPHTKKGKPENVAVIEAVSKIRAKQILLLYFRHVDKKRIYRLKIVPKKQMIKTKIYTYLPY